MSTRCLMMRCFLFAGFLFPCQIAGVSCEACRSMSSLGVLGQDTGARCQCWILEDKTNPLGNSVVLTSWSDCSCYPTNKESLTELTESRWPNEMTCGRRVDNHGVSSSSTLDFRSYSIIISFMNQPTLISSPWRTSTPSCTFINNYFPFYLSNCMI